MPRLTREEFLAARPRFEDVTVEEWGGAAVRVWEVPAARRIEFEQAVENESDVVQAWALLAAFCVGDEDGPWGLTPDQVKAKGTSALKLLFDVATRVNAIGRKEMDKLRKNSQGEPGCDSPTGSQAT